MIDEILIRQTLDATGPARRERVFAFAELWHRHTGSLPTTKETRDHVGKGSYGDVQRDLKDFAGIIQSKTERTATIPGLPRDLELKVGEVIAALWQTIYEKAQGEFAADRQVLDTELPALSGKLDAAEKDRHQALEDRSNALGRLAEVERQLVAAKESVAAELRNVSERNITIAQLQTRIGEMETEQVRLKADHATELRALQAQLKERENRVLDLHAAAETIKTGYEGQLQAAHTLETEHRIRANQAEAARQKAQDSLEATANELANLRGQFEGRAGRLATLEVDRDQAISRIALLERDLESVTEKFSVAVEENASLSHQVTTLSEAVEQRQGAIDALQSKVAKLEPAGQPRPGAKT